MNANDRHYLAVEFTHQFGIRTVQYSTTVDTEQVPDCRLATSPTRENSTPSLIRLSGQLRRAFSFLTMLAFLLVTLEFIMTRGSVVDPDIWWHLRNAEYLFQHHQFPRADMYSFTVEGHPWINHEWLSEIPYYLAWRAGGLSGVDAVMFATISLIFLGLLYLSYMETRHFKAAIVACCFLTFIASVSFGPRTILFGYLYLVLLLVILQRFRQKGNAPLWLIPPLFCLWANTHGSWSLGLIVFSIITAAGFAQGSWGRVDAQRWTPSQMGKLAVTGLASVAALFVNPFGSRLVFYPFDMAFRQKLNISHVAEWVSVDFHDLRGKFVLALLLTLLVTALLRRTRWRLAELGLVLFALYSGLTYVRFLFLLAIVIAPVLTRILEFVPQYRPKADTPLINALVICLMIGSIIHYWPTSAEMQKSISEKYPTQALTYLKAHPPNGPVLNFYLWGGYLAWNDRDLKVFIDSRVDIYEYAGVLKDYLDLLNLSQSKSILDKYKIRYVLFPQPGGYSESALTYVLEHDSQWKVIYSDATTVLLERNAARTAT
ncbi:MAG TPA: hypothetical protein VK667_05200 [Ktedonobacteraceae bacterium]|nr:hypothetical protein [Ktedonobacteraceae bacterium]